MGKKGFTIVLNTGENNFNGTFTNATFFSDLKKILKYDDLQKSYNMYFVFKGGDETASTVVNNSPTYISIAFNNSFKGILSTTLPVATGILFVNTDNVAGNGSLIAKYYDNAPTYISNLNNVDTINVQMYYTAGNTKSALTNITSGWILILYFEEI